MDGEMQPHLLEEKSNPLQQDNIKILNADNSSTMENHTKTYVLDNTQQIEFEKSDSITENIDNSLITVENENITHTTFNNAVLNEIAGEVVTAENLLDGNTSSEIIHDEQIVNCKNEIVVGNRDELLNSGTVPQETSHEEPVQYLDTLSKMSTSELEENQIIFNSVDDIASLSNEVHVNIPVIMQEHPNEIVNTASVEVKTEDKQYVVEQLVDENTQVLIGNITPQTETSHTVEGVILINEGHPDANTFTQSDNILENHSQIIEEPTIITLSETNEQSEQLLIVHSVDNVIVMETDEITDEFVHPDIVEVAVLNTPESAEEETKIEQSEEIEHAETIPKKSVKASDKPLKIPPHVLGRNVDNPIEDAKANGRVSIPKPRLGVKIPYRNLTSQIVSKEEIAHEVMERSRMRNANPDPPAKGDLLFAKKLTQRLAKKLVQPKTPGSDKKGTPQKQPSSPKKVNLGSQVSIESPSASTSGTDKSKNSAIKDNSDLLAILEGDDEMDWSDMNLKSNNTKTPEVTEITTKIQKDLERQLALKQLSELPNRSRTSNLNSAVSRTSHLKDVSRSTYKPLDRKTSSQKQDISDKASESKDDGTELSFCSSSVMKTYTRKRKPSEDIASYTETPKKLAMSGTITNVKKPVAEAETTKKPSTPNANSVTKKSVVSKTDVKDKKSTVPKIDADVTDKRLITLKPKVAVATSSPKSDTVVKKPLALNSDNAKNIAVQSEQKTINLAPNTYISKSSRVVKRKVIWDPDEAVPKTKMILKSPKLSDGPKDADVDSSPHTVKAIEKKLINKTLASKSNLVSTVDKCTIKKTVKKIGKLLMSKKNKPKRLSEVDKLLMDEGAVNMLYSVKNTEEGQHRQKKMSTISLDKAQKELLNKTKEIRNDLEKSSTEESPKSLRKKDPVAPPKADTLIEIIPKKKSKDKETNRNSLHSPPASPAYEFVQPAEASRIIRRHSSSSFSSLDSNSEIQEKEKKTEEIAPSPKEEAKKVTEKVIKQKAVSAKNLKSKKAKQGVDNNQIIISKQNQKSENEPLSATEKQALNKEMSENFNKLILQENEGVSHTDPQYLQFKTFNVRKVEKLVQMTLTPQNSNGQTVLSVQVLQELCAILDILQADEDCRVLVISSSGSSFCQGIDYKSLVLNNKANRKLVAEEMSSLIRQFLVSLAKFPKLVVAGVHGNTVGLGVTMLPLFDMVLASDTATFSTPYTRLGCAAEGGILLTLPHMMHNSLASELFYASRKLTASEALRLGLVTRTLLPDKFQEELVTSFKTISNQSLQSMKAIKKQLRRHLLSDLESCLKSEMNTLVQHWTSVECQKNFNTYNVDDN